QAGARPGMPHDTADPEGADMTIAIAIVGGGLAAATAATELRDRGYDGDVVIYSAEDHLPYERPPLSKEILLGAKQPEDAQVHDEAWYAENRVRLERGVRVVSIDR